ncbi:hypothetical protein TNCT_31521, partial [Trichonephila clavata]
SNLLAKETWLQLEGLSADRVLLPSLYGENLYTHRSLSDENPEK